MLSLLDFTPALIVFDKDGTLIDFNFMWASWIAELAQRLEHATHHPLTELLRQQPPLTELLYHTLGYDAANARVLAGAPLAVCSMKTLRDMTTDIVWRSGFSRADAERITAQVWFVPDPVALAHPVADLAQIFSTLHARGIRLGVATSDDRAPTQATLDALGIAPYVDALVCADDGLPNKPAPDMLLHLCRTLDVSPSQMVMVGDAVADLEMGRNAQVARVMGVMTGLTDARELAPHADLILHSVADLI
ncbi:MAG: HAD family hydrolase [Chloroflexi bacterium]|nr:HAD family hydrolase [Chloroflexota bacterium]